MPVLKRHPLCLASLKRQAGILLSGFPTGMGASLSPQLSELAW